MLRIVLQGQAAARLPLFLIALGQPLCLQAGKIGRGDIASDIDAVKARRFEPAQSRVQGRDHPLHRVDILVDQRIGTDELADFFNAAVVRNQLFAGRHIDAVDIGKAHWRRSRCQINLARTRLTRHLNDLPSAESIGINAANRALARLSPRKIPSQQAVVYFEPRVGKQLISAFVGAISGSSITRGTSFLKDAMGEQIFSRNLFITDDPLRPRGLSSRPFDAEGIAGVKRDFIANGTLTSWLLDTRSANQLGLVTTGHASRGLASAPHPSCTNLYLHGGEQTPDEIFAQLGDGFYVTETIGHGANLLTGDFSVGAGGFWLEGGKKTFPISEVTIAGNLREMFRHLVAANDLEFRYGVNVPTLAIPKLTIAGS